MLTEEDAELRLEKDEFATEPGADFNCFGALVERPKYPSRPEIKFPKGDVSVKYSVSKSNRRHSIATKLASARFFRATNRCSSRSSSIRSSAEGRGSIFSVLSAWLESEGLSRERASGAPATLRTSETRGFRKGLEPSGSALRGLEAAVMVKPRQGV